MKFALFASLVAGASAFAPAPLTTSSSALKSYEDEAGVLAPTGYFDPLGLAANIDQATFDQYRAAELKHGRVSMLAVVGYVTAECTRFPGEIAPGLKFADIPNGVKAIDAVPALGWFQIAFLIGAVDYYGFFEYPETNPALDADELAKRKDSELTHGRLAMLAIAELVRHDCHINADPTLDNGLTDLITGFPFLYSSVLWGEIPH